MTKNEAADLLTMVAERWAKEHGYVGDEHGPYLFHHPDHPDPCESSVRVQRDGGHEIKYMPVLTILENFGPDMSMDACEIGINDTVRSEPPFDWTGDFCNVRVYALKRGVTWATEILGWLREECPELVM